MSTDQISVDSDYASPDPAGEDHPPTHSFYSLHSTEIVAAYEIGKQFDEIQLTLPEKDEFVVNNVFCYNRHGCSEAYKTNNDRNLHIRQVETPVLCPHCDRRMAYQSYMKKHAETHVNESLRQRFSCPGCQELFTRKDNMDKHRRLKKH